MNKFQRIAYQMAKDDSKKEVYEGQNISKRGRICCANWKRHKESWPFEKCVDFKNVSKNSKW